MHTIGTSNEDPGGTSLALHVSVEQASKEYTKDEREIQLGVYITYQSSADTHLKVYNLFAGDVTAETNDGIRTAKFAGVLRHPAGDITENPDTYTHAYAIYYAQSEHIEEMKDAIQKKTDFLMKEAKFHSVVENVNHQIVDIQGIEARTTKPLQEPHTPIHKPRIELHHAFEMNDAELMNNVA